MFLDSSYLSISKGIHFNFTKHSLISNKPITQRQAVLKKKFTQNLRHSVFDVQISFYISTIVVNRSFEMNLDHSLLLLHPWTVSSPILLILYSKCIIFLRTCLNDFNSHEMKIKKWDGDEMKWRTIVFFLIACSVFIWINITCIHI